MFFKPFYPYRLKSVVIGENMGNVKFAKRIFFAVFTAILSFCVCMSTTVGVYASSVSDLEQKISEAQKKAATLEGKAADAKETYQAKLDVYYAASEAVNEIDSEIISLQNKIEKTTAEIKSLDIKIEKQQKLIDKKYADFKERLKALYIAGSLTSVQVLFSSGDFSEYLTRLEMIRRVSQKDNDAIDEMTKLAEELVKAQEELDQDKIKLESEEKSLKQNRVSLEEKKTLAETSKNESLVILKQIKAQEQQNNSQLQEYKEDLQDVLAEIARREAAAAAAANSGNESSGNTSSATPIVNGTGQFCYPVPGHTTIYCGFYGYSNHNGVDFSDGGIYGAGVVAADSGTVVRVRYLTYSYGYHIYIYHGNGLTTQYCHLSAIYVSEGQAVTKGQSIGAVGSTGNSTGPHLHFGIFDRNGNFLNPENYL